MFAKKTISHICSVLFVIVFLLSATPLQAVRAAGIRYATPGGTGNCSDWAYACTLQTALTGATSGDEIWVAAGTYKPTTDPTDRTATFQLISGVALYGGFAGTETARSQRNPAVNLTILSGDIGTPGDNSDNSYHVVTGVDGAILDGFTITAGNANGVSDPNNSGGGMYNVDGSPMLANVTFIGNSAHSGGGMDNYYSNPTLTNVTFSGNSATDGGGMDNYYSNPRLWDVTFSSNTAMLPGGGMLNSESNPTLTEVTFIGNHAADGGGMSNYDSNPTLTDVTFSGNSSTYGGGMDNNYSNPKLTNVTFSGNSVNAAYASVSGGGMGNYYSNPKLTNVTFSGNSANYDGGGMENEFSNPMIRNTIFWSNTSSNAGAQIYNDPNSTPNVSYSVVQGGYAGGTNIITIDPKLGTLGNNGGFTLTIPLLAGSSAIDTGNDTVCPATDQRGVARPQGVHCDIGAFEVIQIYSIYLPLILR